MKSIITFCLIVFSFTLFAQKGLNDFTFKRPFRVVATSNITLSGTQTIDGVSLNVDDRVLLTNQSTGSQNGPMVVKSGTWVRPVDFNDVYDAKSGMFAVVEEGTANGNSIWMLTTNNPITLGTTSLTFVKTYPSASGVATVSAGSGISISGTTDVTVSATDASVTNETLADNNQTLSGSRTITINGNDLGILGSTYRTFWSAAGNFGVSDDAFTPFNTVHVKHSGTSALSGIVGRGHTITANNATPPSIYFESPDLTDGSQVMGIQFVSNSGLGLWKLASFNDAGSSATVNNIIAATHAGNVGFGIVPVFKQHIHVAAATTAVTTKYSNTSSGALTTDGFDVGITNAPTPVVELRNRENSNMVFYNNNTQRMILDDDGSLYLGTGTTSTIIGLLTTHRGSAPTSGLSSNWAVSSSTGLVWSGFGGNNGYLALIQPTSTSGGGLLINGTSSLVRGLDVVANGTPLLCVKNVSGARVGIGREDALEALDVTGNIQMNTAGNKLKIKEGTNASLGTAVMNGTTNVTINTTAVTASSRIFVTIQTVGGTPGVVYISTRVAGTSFDVVSTSALDTSTIAWWIVEPAP